MSDVVENCVQFRGVMEDIVRKRVYVHATSDEELERRTETFASALRACGGSILAVEYRGKVRGRRIASITYEFPLRLLPNAPERAAVRRQPGKRSQHPRRSPAEK
jgi:hypothetical protein